jgi:hypothetical protein
MAVRETFIGTQFVGEIPSLDVQIALFIAAYRERVEVVVAAQIRQSCGRAITHLPNHFHSTTTAAVEFVLIFVVEDAAGSARLVVLQHCVLSSHFHCDFMHLAET